ncbi:MULTISPECIES: helix-turn-helix domain-containing protein [Variovorax]|jgi:HTH-type transcriptional regulator / antitoxin HipB|uniref:helix-turn-helix domain-containing protein n=1 Tax=Variovorax TaxID=34072 RepID=UPI00086E676B|nr:MULTISPECIES: helix-turn-helix domain-containing protein [Variovorax]MBN8758399.1 helix-turn-helix transcriptional regulator [Variovorax sp.]ODU12540.1 MAG: transcriptional regulator [Variovorax sp. SCN 67-85]ODV18088.1 MAG: transcriptional regulator [Variovorax sp. SCN 67-20]OJZ05963.1 MAG: transcriptional regulator [Variovorax sp. 67-131]UKI08853.1 helix-turn-helix domain-containing protein [Variovorax paradoxus]
MDYPLRFVDQLRPHLKALRKQRGLTQAQAGALIGVSQARVAEIEANPGAVSFEQLMKLLSALGASFCLRDEAVPGGVLVAAEEPALYDAVKLPPGPWTATQMSDQSVLVRLEESESPGAPGESLRALQALNPGKDIKPTSRRSFVVRPKRESW